MSIEHWQPRWPFDFAAEYKARTKADDAAVRANRFWCFEQKKSLKQNCRVTSHCWPSHDVPGGAVSVPIQLVSTQGFITTEV